MSSDFSEISLIDERKLPLDLKESLAKLTAALDVQKTLDRLHTALDLGDSGENRNNDNVEEIGQKASPLQEWTASPLVESTRLTKRELCRKAMAAFPMFKKVDEIVQTLYETDVVCLIAPTGSGKSILAAYIAEKFAALSRSSGGVPYRKSFLSAPTAQHCASTARIFNEIFGYSGIKVSAFLNPYEELQVNSIRSDWRSGRGEREFVISTYNAAMRVLPHAKLNLLFIDEVHEPNDNVQVTIAMALKMLLASPFVPSRRGSSERTLNKLILMTATLDEKERERYEKYFTSQGLSFKLLDFSDKLQRNKQLTMSCITTATGSPVPEMFEVTPLSDRISNYVYGLLPGVTLDAKYSPTRMQYALMFAMELATENLQKRLESRVLKQKKCKEGEFDMQSIIVILPGQEQVDRMYSAAFNLNEFMFEGGPAFHPVRLTSLVRDDELITTECSQRGKWKPEGHLGRIVFTTSTVASGLTVPNAAYVVDCAQLKMISEYTKDGLKHLEMVPVDRSMITQRAGRTGRTTDGEYFLPYSAEKVREMLGANRLELMLNRNFEERHLLYKKIYKLRLLHEPPEKLVKELLASMHIRGLFCETDGFPKDVLLMNSIFNFLSPEHARILIQGAKMGIAAHAILLVADSISRVKFCRADTAGKATSDEPTDPKSVIRVFCEEMDEKHGRQGRYAQRGRRLPEKYRGAGDSIAIADLLASFFAVVPRDHKRHALDQIRLSDSNFWCQGLRLSELYALFVREEGRDSVTRYVCQIEAALRASGCIPKSSDFLDKRINRHLVSRENFCLNEEGRALLSALLTIHSSRVGYLTNDDVEPSYKIYNWQSKTFASLEDAVGCWQSCFGDMKTDSSCSKSGGTAATPAVRLNPDSGYSQPAGGILMGVNNCDSSIYGRFTEMFLRNEGYTGTIDPINVKQMTYFLNVNGERIIRDDSSERSLLLKLNASTAKGGIKIIIPPNGTTIKDVRNVRGVLERALEKLTRTMDEGFIADLEKFIIKLWRECEKTEEDPPVRSATLAPSRLSLPSVPSAPSPPPYPPPSYASIFGDQPIVRPATLHEEKDRYARAEFGGGGGSDVRREQTDGRGGEREGFGSGRASDVRREQSEGRSGGRGGRGAVGGGRGSSRGTQRGGGRGGRGRGRQDRGGRGGNRGARRGGETNLSEKQGATIRLG